MYRQRIFKYTTNLCSSYIPLPLMQPVLLSVSGSPTPTATPIATLLLAATGGILQINITGNIIIKYVYSK